MMAASLTPTLIDKDFRNWLKGALAALFAREGLLDFVENEIIAHNVNLLNDVCMLNRIPVGTICNSCTTANVLACPTAGFCRGKKCNVHDPKISSLKPNQPCQYGLCSALRDAIRNEHRYGGPSWKNTDTTKWCTDAFQIAKCYMPPDGYSDKARFAETDFNGVIAVIINNKRFENKMSTNFNYKANICEEARKAGRKIRHVPKHQLSDTELASSIDVFIQLLSDPKYLAADVKAMEAVAKLKKLKTNTLTISADDITSVLNDNIRATFDDQQKTLINKINQHFQTHQTDSVEAIDRKVHEFVDLANTQFDKLKSQTEKGIVELNKKKETGINEVNIQIKAGKDVLITKTKKGIYELKTQTERGKAALDVQCKHEKFELRAQTEKGKEDLEAHTKQMKHDLDDKSILLYTRTIDKATKMIHAKTNKGKQEIEEHGKKVCEQVTRSCLLNTGKSDDTLVRELKEELVRFYLAKESMIPASPLVEEYAVPIMKLYVQPPMSAFIKPIAFGQGKKSPEKKLISSYRKLFLNDDNVPYKNIYVEANAGYGKTSFTQKVAMIWCLTLNPKSKLDKNQQEDIDTLKRFDLMFLIHLRDFQGDRSCLMDDLILKFVSKNLPRKERFSKEFIGRMLQNKTCLVIFDGLDEWVHPETCQLTPGIPHNNYREHCTQLTTTRPWKMSTIGLQPNMIDIHLEISTLDEKSSKELKSNAVKLLSENSDAKEPDLNDFDRKISSVKLGDIRLIPYLLLQLICIWFDGFSIGRSKCETYSNIIELTLERGLKKKNTPTLPTGNADLTVPECIRHNALSNQYVKLLLTLGKLAFWTLFQKIKESSLVIEITTVLRFLTEQELEFCLKIGLLNQNKDCSTVSLKRYKVCFQHKSVQEFMAALYITSEWDNGHIKLTILEMCSSLSSILENEHLFVFVCGMNPEVYACISAEFQKIVELDSVTRQSRSDMYVDRYHEARRTMKSYQSMQIQCLQESVRNGNERCSVHLSDIMIDDYSLTEELKTIIKTNKCNVKSLQLSFYEMTEASLQPLGRRVFNSLETFIVEDCRKEPFLLTDILCESACTLKCVTISLGCSLSDVSISALTRLTSLQSFYLKYVHMTHNIIKCLYAYIGRTTTLIKLNLGWIDCSDHRGRYNECDLTLDLYRLNKLKMLHLYPFHCQKLHVNAARLEDLMFQPRKEKTTSAKLWQDLRGAPVLSSVTLYNMSACQEMIQTIPSLTQLHYLQLKCVDMCDVIPHFSPAMALKRVELVEVTMPSDAWMELFFSIGQLPQITSIKLKSIKMTFRAWRELLLSVGGMSRPVIVELSSCKGISLKEWQLIENVIQTTPTLSLLQNVSPNEFGYALTLRNRIIEIS